MTDVNKLFENGDKGLPPGAIPTLALRWQPLTGPTDANGKPPGYQAIDYPFMPLLVVFGELKKKSTLVTPESYTGATGWFPVIGGTPLVNKTFRTDQEAMAHAETFATHQMLNLLSLLGQASEIHNYIVASAQDHQGDEDSLTE